MKSGFVMLAGRSNVGKSTLLNALVGSKVSIVTPKPQTTRRPIRGILHDKRGQIVFVDTPGVFLGNKDAVSKKLNDFVRETLEGIDAIVYVMDPTREPGPEEALIQKLLSATSVPVILAVNKRDLPDDKRPFAEIMRETNVGQITTLEISAKTHRDVNRLIDTIFAILPEGEPHYPDLQVSDLRHKEWLQELIREKVFLSLEKELPYSTTVVVQDIEERQDGTRFIQADIVTTDERYKRMIIGAKAAKIKSIGMQTRKELEAVLQSKIFLELNVVVDPKWQERFQ